LNEAYTKINLKVQQKIAFWKKLVYKKLIQLIIKNKGIDYE